MNGQTVFRINIERDDATNMFIATSEDIPGLGLEAETLDEMAACLRDSVPILLQESGCLAKPDGSEFVDFSLNVRTPLSAIASIG